MLIMKKTRLLIALLVMLVAASGYAQDSYREAVKDYLTAIGQFEKEKAYISTLSMMFERDGEVDIDQLTQRYLDERYENDMINFYVTAWKEQGMTEADLRELSSLLSTPQYKVFDTHYKDWMMGFATNMLEPLMELMSNVEEQLESGEYKYKESKYLSRMESPIQPNAEIDAEYAEKFNSVMMKSSLVKTMTDAMFKRMDEGMDRVSIDEPIRKESQEKVKDWMTKSLPAMLLNNAYGNLTLEDLDYAAKLYANEPFCKLQNNDLSNVDMESLKMAHAFSKYMTWMEEQGAKKSEDPKAFMKFVESLFESINPNN
jgi:hypothetical protein